MFWEMPGHDDQLHYVQTVLCAAVFPSELEAEWGMKSQRSIALIHKNTSNSAECYWGHNTTLGCITETNTIGCQSQKFLN